VQRYGQGDAAQPAQPGTLSGGIEDGYVQPVLERREREAADPPQERAVGGAAAQVHMLPVVDGERPGRGVPSEGERKAAEAGAGFEQGGGHSGVGEPQCGGGAGEAAADHDGAAPCSGVVQVRAGHVRTPRFAVYRVPMPVSPRTAT
jgi:hypothetical protein